MDNNNLGKVYEQYWLHARYQETQRLWFTNVYALIITGVFAYLATSGLDNSLKVILLMFLTLLSLFGYLLTYSWNLPFTEFSRLAELIAINEWNLAEDYQRFSSYKKKIRANRLFVGFYSLMLGAFAALLFQTVYKMSNSGIPDWVIIVIGLIVFLGFYLFYCFCLEKPINKIQEEFEGKIKKSQN